MKKNIFINFLFILCVNGACKKNQEVVPQNNSQQTQVCGQSIENSYIVIYKKDSEHALQLAEINGFEEREKFSEQHFRNVLKKYGDNQCSLRRIYHSGVTGFSSIMRKNVVEELRNNSDIESIEQDKFLSIRSSLKEVGITSSQTIPWGVEKVGYGSGNGKTVWIIDTGIDLYHPDLNVDVPNCKSFIECKSTAQDDNGHGTHVAGIIGALDNGIGVLGVAAGAKLIALKALDENGSGSISNIISALQWVSVFGKPGDVINLSLSGTSISSALDKMVYSISMKGILVAIAAGNEECNTDSISPARVNSPNVFTVSAMDINSNWASFSNFGSSVDACSPGVNILSTYLNGKYATMSGTSMAAPHLAGLLLLDDKNLNYSGFVTGDPDGKPDPIAHK